MQLQPLLKALAEKTRKLKDKIYPEESFKHAFVLLLALMLLSFAKPIVNETGVYICKGKGSKRYHYTKSCRGLSNCSTNIYEVSLSKAREIGRTLCGWED